MKKLLRFDPTIIIMILLAVISLIWLMSIVKKDRKFSKKGFTYYSLVNFALFGLLGLMASADTEDDLGFFLLIQGIVLGLGIIHAWLLFSIFEWPDEERFLPESLFTVFQTSIATIAFMGLFFIFKKWIKTQTGGGVNMSEAMLWFIVPYLVLRCYHFMRLIPAKRFNAWIYPSYATPQLNLFEQNIIYAQLIIKRGGGPEERDVHHQARIPKDARIGESFHFFVERYNQEYPNSPIKYLREDYLGNRIGWRFWVGNVGSKKGMNLDPDTLGANLIQLGQQVVVERVLLNPDQQEPEQRAINPIGPSGNETIDLFPSEDDGISIIEK